MRLGSQLLGLALATLLVMGLVACGSTPLHTPSVPVESVPPSGSIQQGAQGEGAALGPVVLRAKSRWTPVAWRELPGFESDALFEAWNAWLKSCERPGPVFAPLCSEVRRLSIAGEAAQRDWMVERLQPYRVEPLQGGATGLLTAYFEPEFEGSRLPGQGFQFPLFRPPMNLGQNKPWFTRQEIDTLPEAKAALQGTEILYLRDPFDVMVMQIQGSGRVRVTEPDGSQRLVRLTYGATNDHPYMSVGRWLIDRGETKDASLPGIRAWLAKNPQRVNELLWSNPRFVFFREVPLGSFAALFGPPGAQGVALTPGRSIAVDPDSIPYGTPVWLASEGPQMPLQRLVLAQDTGSAIRGAVRADYFVGWGAEAGELAGRLKQPLRLWVLWPKPSR